MTDTLVTFDGLMIFHKRTDGFYEVGIMDATLLSGHVPKHEFRINITPDPRSGSRNWRRGPAELEQYLRNRRPWILEVKTAAGVVETGINADESIPDRHSREPSDKRFGWIVNIESHEFHNKRLDRETGMMNPIIRLSKGSLSTFCKSGGVQKKRNKKPIDPNFGYLAGRLALDIDTSAGQTVTMKEDGGADIFMLTPGASYRVDITNDNVAKSKSSHFHVYYEQIFSGEAPKFWFDFAKRTVKDDSPDPCPEQNTTKGIPPYKCGGLLITSGGTPLS